ncbi:MAG: hypothetical protein BRD46_03975 [Bacteroidetes bacterium QS_8_68_15]|nr:MAG: hypothetical protein BRD46_03975 [Bacteroidetes bacterium QS_8_68_15]
MPVLLLAAGAAAVLAAAAAAGCGPDETSAAADDVPPLDSRADSMAMQMYRAHGGPEVWDDVPALAFTFAMGRDVKGADTTRQRVARHWWRRSDGAYRVQWNEGPDSTYTAVFNTNEFSREPPTGRAALNGTRLDSAAEQRALRQAHVRYANDSYWLLAPLKLFNDGVNRSLAADPAQADSTNRALHLSFDQVGITPKDQYWLTPDSTTGRLARWTFALQGMGPDQPPGVFRWTGYAPFSTPAGSLTLSTRKENVGGPRVIYTDQIRTPATLPDSLFSIGRQ